MALRPTISTRSQGLKLIATALVTIDPIAPEAKAIVATTLSTLPSNPNRPSAQTERGRRER